MGEAELLRKLPPNRGNCPPRSRYLALWPDEARRIERSTHRAAAVCSSAVAAGEPASGFVQSRRVSESFEIRRAGAGAAAHSRPRECALPALWADSPQYVYQFACAAEFNAADESASANFICGTDLRSRRLRRVDCNRTAGRDPRGRTSLGRCSGCAAQVNSSRIVDELRDQCRSPEISACEHHL